MASHSTAVTELGTQALQLLQLQLLGASSETVGMQTFMNTLYASTVDKVCLGLGAAVCGGEMGTGGGAVGGVPHGGR